MQGFRTILVAMLSMVGVIAARYGFDFGVEDQAVVATAVMSVAMVVMRLVTKGPVRLPGTEDPNVLRSSWVIAVLALVLMGGCTQLDRIDNDPLKKAGFGILFRHGIDEFIQRDNEPADRAAKIVRYAKIIETGLSADLTTLEGLDKFLVSQLPADQMLPGDYRDALLVIEGSVAMIRQQIADLPEAEQIESARVSVQYFLDIAMTTARAYL